MFNDIKIIRPVGNLINQTKSTNINLTTPHNFYSSGTASLAAALIASKQIRFDIKKPEVIIPAYACPDLISAIVFAQAVPVLVDIDVNSPMMSLKNIDDAITKQTIAIIAIRFFGLQENNKELLLISKQHNLILIEDSAQGFPNKEFDNYWVGDFIILSFGRGKPLNLLGGGAVLSRDSNLIDKLPIPSSASDSLINKLKYKLKLFIYNQSIVPFAYGLITRMPGLNIGQTIYKPLTAINSINEGTKQLLTSNIEAYPTRLNCQNKYTEILKHCNNTIIIDLPSKLKHDMSQPLLRYPILVKEYALRNRLYEKLKPYGASLMYKKPLNEIDNVDKLIKESNGTYENASNFAKHLLTLPTHESVDNKTIEAIERNLKEV